MRKPFRQRRARVSAMVAVLSLLSACGGSGGGTTATGGGGTGTVTPTPTPSPSGSPSACSLRSRQDWVAGQMNEWYLFPETLPASLNPALYGSIDSYLDALTANARMQRKDRYFTYLTSIAEENAYYASGFNIGLGVRFALNSATRQLYISETFEGSMAMANGIDRGDEIVAVGTSEGTLRNVSDILRSEGSAGLANALGPDSIGVTRAFRVRNTTGDVRTLTLTKVQYELSPVSSRYGAKVIEDDGRKVGYINLRTFISPAEAPLRQAFADFQALGITDIIIDLRYNGGGLISVANLVNNLLGGDKTGSQVASYTRFRASKASNDETTYFAAQPQSIAPTRIAFIGTGGTASASELVMNAFIPYLGNRSALIGTNTYGKPVGQIAIDRSTCDDRLRVVALAVENSDRQGAYYDGLADFMGATCQAEDDLTRQMGDPNEGSTRRALDFLAGRACTPIGAAATASANRSAAVGPRMEPLSPERPSTAQREVPGLY